VVKEATETPRSLTMAISWVMKGVRVSWPLGNFSVPGLYIVEKNIGSKCASLAAACLRMFAALFFSSMSQTKIEWKENT